MHSLKSNYGLFKQPLIKIISVCQQRISMESPYFIIILLGAVPFLGWFLLQSWYFRRVVQYQAQIYHPNGRIVPARPPKVLLGNLPDVYQAENKLDAYHQFHEQHGEIVQIYWMWRQQLSVTNFKMVEHILLQHQHNYQKFPPNQLIQKLYGESVLTTHGQQWKRHRTIVQSIFLPQHIAGFHDLFGQATQQLITHWQTDIVSSADTARHNIYPDLIALFLDIIGQAGFGTEFGAQRGEIDEVIASIRFILEQSTLPQYQFIAWWQHLPLPNNDRLRKAFARVNDFLYGLIQERRAALQQNDSTSANLLNLLLQATESIDPDIPPLTDKEVRDNLLAIIINGFETVATSVSLSLDLLARHPDAMQRAQAEVDQAFAQDSFYPSHLTQLPYLKAIVVESLRLCPPMAGLQRLSIEADTLEEWSIPEQQAVGIPLRPLHLNPQLYGEHPDQFCPERYLDNTAHLTTQAIGGCPLKRFLGYNQGNGNHFPISFGEGARRCLGETFALHEMTIVLGLLLHHFTFLVKPGDEAVMELGKFGLFISMLPKDGVYLLIRNRDLVNHG
jgi:cytochrome P450